MNSRKSKSVRLILFDFNGVTVRADHKLTARHFGKIHRTPWRKVYDLFYTKYFNLIVEGKLSEKDGWKQPIEELGWRQDWRAMRSWHLRQPTLQRSIIKLVTRLRGRGYACVLLSKNLQSWFRILEQRLHFMAFFDASINTQELGLPKASPETVRLICRRFKMKPRQIIYIDDQPENLVAPRRMGVRCIPYRTAKQCAREINARL